jgi:hypothetical protein
MLPQLEDTPKKAINKLKLLAREMRSNYSEILDSYNNAGYNVSRYEPGDNFIADDYDSWMN